MNFPRKQTNFDSETGGKQINKQISSATMVRNRCTTFLIMALITSGIHLVLPL